MRLGVIGFCLLVLGSTTALPAVGATAHCPAYGAALARMSTTAPAVAIVPSASTTDAVTANE